MNAIEVKSIIDNLEFSEKKNLLDMLSENCEVEFDVEKTVALPQFDEYIQKHVLDIKKEFSTEEINSIVSSISNEEKYKLFNSLISLKEKFFASEITSIVEKMDKKERELLLNSLMKFCSYEHFNLLIKDTNFQRFVLEKVKFNSIEMKELFDRMDDDTRHSFLRSLIQFYETETEIYVAE